jgi:anti-sigma factor RsiW
VERPVTCREFADFMMDYRSGELPPDSREQFELHLGLCPNCQAYLTSYEESVTLGKRAFEGGDRLADEVPEDLVKAILAARRQG